MKNFDEKFYAMRKGLLELAVLKVIQKEKVYAGDILERLGRTEFATQEGTLYPMLSRMKREAFLDYEWVESEAGPPRKYYLLTPKGEEQLAALLEYWRKLNETINSIF